MAIKADPQIALKIINKKKLFDIILLIRRIFYLFFGFGNGGFAYGFI